MMMEVSYQLHAVSSVGLYTAIVYICSPSRKGEPSQIFVYFMSLITNHQGNFFLLLNFVYDSCAFARHILHFLNSLNIK